MTNDELYELMLAKSFLSKIKKDSFFPTEDELETIFYFIVDRVGVRNAITSEECSMRLGIMERKVRRAFEILPVVTLRNGKGYFWPEIESEIDKCTSALNSGKCSIQRHMYRLIAFKRRFKSRSNTEQPNTPERQENAR